MFTIKKLSKHDILSCSGYDKVQHESVFRIEDSDSHLKGYIAIYQHTASGAIGGTRVYPYASDKEALCDALRLSDCMQHKNRVVNSSLGGAKACLISPPDGHNHEAWLHAYAEVLNKLPLAFFTGMDVGLGKDDVRVLYGLSDKIVGYYHDPSQYTAEFLFRQIQTLSKSLMQTESLKNTPVAIQGLGKVGGQLFSHLAEQDAHIFVHDINPNLIKQLKAKYPKNANLHPKDIHAVPVAFFAPCALGQIFHPNNINSLQCKVICGSANNQLSDNMLAEILHKKGIVYVPDYFSSCGGLVSVIAEVENPHVHREMVTKKFDTLCEKLSQYIYTSQEQDLSLDSLFSN